jgi:choline-phosphate cytidylyltransferase
MNSSQMSIPDGTDPLNPVRIYTDGIFDCFHFGHARLLKQIKEMFPHVYLIVGVCGDEVTWKEKGKTIMLDYERYESIKHCKWADEVYENAPWIPTIDLLDSLKCHYHAHDPEPYPMGDIEDVYGEVKLKGRFLGTKRTEGISTSDIMMRIIRHYDEYVERNVSKGAKPEDLNIKVDKWFAFKLKTFVSKVERKQEERKKKNPLAFYFKRWSVNK